MTHQIFLLRFEDISLADANLNAEELRNILLESSPDITVQRERSNPATQDIGSTLVLVLSSSSALAAIKAISNWLQLRNKASLTIEIPEKKFIIQNVTSKEASKLAELVLINHTQDFNK